MQLRACLHVQGRALRSSGYGVGASLSGTPKRNVPPLPEGVMMMDEKTQQLAAMREVCVCMRVCRFRRYSRLRG